MQFGEGLYKRGRIHFKVSSVLVLLQVNRTGDLEFKWNSSSEDVPKEWMHIYTFLS